MKVHATISKTNIKLDGTGKTSIISAVVIFTGIITGIVIYSFADEALKESIGNRFIIFASDFADKNKPEIFSGLICQNIFYCVLMLVFAFCIYGTPAVFFLSFIKAVGLGVLTTYIYDTYVLKGIEYCLLIIFPGKFILIFSMILLTQNCYINSNSLTSFLTKRTDEGVNLKKYILRTVVISLLMAISVTVDFITLISFSSLFDFA